MRVQFSLSDKMVERLDSLAGEIGMTRGGACNYLITQGLLSYEATKKTMATLPEELVKKLVSEKE